MATVHELLLKPFSMRSNEEKLNILLEGRPKPELTKAVSPNMDTIENFDIYDRVPWLTGCEKVRALFCWPCLLFSEERNEWNVTGFTELTVFDEGMVKHRNTTDHLSSLFQQQLFLYRNAPPPKEIVTFNPEEDQIKNNRECMQRIIDAVCYVVSQQCSTTTENRANPKKLEVQDCIDVLQFLSDYEYDTTIFNTAINILKTYPKILTDVISAIASVIKNNIKEEIQMSTYASLVLNEHSDINKKSKISTVLRYLSNSHVCERFLGYTVLKEYKTANVIYQFILHVIKEYNITEQFLAYSVDGAVLATSYHIKTLKTKLRDDYSFCLFVPCYFHDLDFVLEQSLSHLMKIKHFFKNMRLIKDFFHYNHKACTIFEGFIGSGIISELDRDEWSDSRFLKLLKTHRMQFIKFFESVVLNHQFWEVEDVPKALAFQQILQEFDIVFVLEICFRIFNRTAALRNMLSSHLFVVAICSDVRDSLKSSLNEEINDGVFEHFWANVVSEMLGGEQDSKNLSLKQAIESDNKFSYRQLYLQIIDLVNKEINDRFDSLADLLFFDIFDHEAYSGIKREKMPFNDESPLKSLLSVYGSHFEESWVQNEYKVFSKNSSLFPSKSVYDLLEFFTTADLKDTFRNLYRIAELVLTMPCKPPSTTSSGSSKLKKINEWSFVSENEVCSNDLALLCIEEEYLDELKNKPNFLNDVLLNFQQLNSTFRVVSS